MTSNIGSDVILENTLNAMLSPEQFNDTKEKVLTILRSRFKPEFLNRIDETIFFKALNLQQLSKIVDIQMDYLRDLLKDQELTFEISDDAKEFLATQGFNPVYGARPLKRVIRQMVENPLSKLILGQTFVKGDHIKIDLDDDKLRFTK
jgi:ATP-dependent Clp protease ATP-binding subunit ClpB